MAIPWVDAPPRPAPADPEERRRWRRNLLARRGRRRRAPAPWAPRADGPHVRWALVWVALVVPASVLAPTMLAMVMATTAALAAAALVHGQRPVVVQVAVAGAASVVLAGLRGTDGLAVALPLLALCAFAAVSPWIDPMAVGPVPVADDGSVARGHRLTIVGAALTAAIVPGLAAASPLLAADFGAGAPLGLLALLAAHDVGSYLVGTTTGATWEGPAAAVVCVLATAFPVGVLNLFGAGVAGTAVVATVVAATAPLGPPLTHVLAGGGGPQRWREAAPIGWIGGAALGRLDAFVVAGPLAVAALAAVA